MRFRKRTRALFALGAIAVTASLWSGCSPKKQTELVPGVSTQVRIPKDLKSIRLDATVNGVSAFCGVYDVTNGVARLPRTLALQSQGKGGPVTVYVTGFKHATTDPEVSPDQQACAITPIPSVKDLKNPDGTVRILRAARTSYLADHVLFVPMPLRFSCFDKGCPREQDKVCKAGKCVDIADDKNLVEDDDNLIFGNSSTCFSPAACLPDAVLPVLVDAATCKYALPKTKGAPDGGAAFPFETHGTGVNVRAFYDDGSFSEVLDLDKDEGFFIPDPVNAPQTFQLAEGLCHPDADTPHKVVGLVASGLCPSKTPLQPICDGESPSNPESDASAPEDLAASNCTSLEVKPAPSALVVLLDDTKDMEPFYGIAGAKEVLNLSLQDPVFENTFIALDFMPSSGGANQCGGGKYGDSARLDVDFQKAIVAQQKIAGKLSTKGSPENPLLDPPRQLDAALDRNGVYKLLRTLKSQAAEPYSKLAVLVLSNGDFTEECSQTSLPAQAVDARADDIKTYVVMFGRKNASTDPNRVTKAAALAAAGGTPFFNVDTGAGGSEAAGLDALGQVTTDLATCVYDIPGKSCTLDTNGTLKCLGGTPLEGTRAVSYFNPLPPTPGQVKIPFNAACSITTRDTAPGWNLDPNGRVLICGSDCNALRDVLKNTAKLYEILHQAPPAVPIHVSNCKETPTPKPEAGADSGRPPEAGSDSGATDAGPTDASGG